LATERRVRVWRRYRAVLLLGDGHPPEGVAQLLGCSRSSVYGWATTWRRAGLPGLAGQPPGGGVVRLEERAGPLLEAALAADPQARGHHATGWTVPLLRTELAAAGIVTGERTIRRALHRLGWRWKRPKFVLGRPDPAYAEKKGPS
jgi:transposase